MLWHYKHLGFERNAARHAAQAARLGNKDLENGWGHRYSWPRERLGWQWDELRATSLDLAVSSAHPAAICERPLWWRPDQRLGDLLDRIPVVVNPCPMKPPRVSVNASTDDTVPILRSTDWTSCIHVDAFAHAKA